ncbi:MULTISPECIES: ABC transporter permease [Bacillus]|jgi:glycine betaine/proline transport system permease protein|uniref:Glycine betaine transport system permease protein n=13 Tax=Bacillus cereus group TaxID=86661 RepID=Q81CH4_BACCR|nr:MULTISPECIES: proline/glycine betaine ABC transporter permease [Bacillus]MCO4216493.1 proline/glycine betaine ABC transporter permease [Bacillus sp. 10017]MCX2703225.1 proline/glycine betaine ABC transporter permease [Bacillus sp. AS_5]MEB4843397.1 proline/glycine betaine ABC transporter permease [Paenibacillus jamilae]TKV45460.1 proline/glycine betaine ABC transporter permease [Bacillus sp. PIC28]AAP09743.1 Glycine betaine transport system permease protein [Bacillus cereus ATCC 14579]
MNSIPRIPLGEWVDSFVASLYEHFEGLFRGFSYIIGGFVDLLTNFLTIIPAILMIIILCFFIWYTTRKLSLVIFTLIGLLFILNINYWAQTMQTLALVLTSVIISIIVGIPIGILASQNERFSKFLKPTLDFMQTMPAFVYLIPAITFFGVGVVPGIIASVIFAMPPTIRFTDLGIRQVPEDLIEAANAFGSTASQKLFKVQLPLATGTIMAGVNQSIMLSLSMVVTASLVGAPGLGVDVYRSVTQVNIGMGFEAGLAIVVIAIILDRITQGFHTKRK